MLVNSQKLIKSLYVKGIKKLISKSREINSFRCEKFLPLEFYDKICDEVKNLHNFGNLQASRISQQREFHIISSHSRFR